MSLAKTLKKLRENAGLSQRDVASKLGYTTPQMVSNNERGISYPPIKTLKTLARLYNTDANYLFTTFKDDFIKREVEKLNRKWRSLK